MPEAAASVGAGWEDVLGQLAGLAERGELSPVG
jgi:hypothetical protein